MSEPRGELFSQERQLWELRVGTDIAALRAEVEALAQRLARLEDMRHRLSLDVFTGDGGHD